MMSLVKFHSLISYFLLLQVVQSQITSPTSTSWTPITTDIVTTTRATTEWKSSSTPTPGPQLCIDMPNLTLNFSINSQFPGTWSDIWYVSATHPTPPKLLLCPKIEFNLRSGQGLKINVTYSNEPDMPWLSKFLTGVYDEKADQRQAYRLRFFNGSTYTTWINYKLLETDWLNYAFLCGYADDANMETSFGLLLTHNSNLSIAELSDFWEIAAGKYSNFPTGVMSDILQDDSCMFGKDTGSRLTPLVVSIMATMLIPAVLT